MIESNKVKCEIVERIGALDAPNDKGWTKELNVVAWNGGEPKLDVREWSPDHQRMSKGITLTEKQGVRFARLLAQRERDKQRDAAERDPYVR